MITPHLEKLILCGKASFNTFSAGASEKSVLYVDNDRFIIITGITYFPMIINRNALSVNSIALQRLLRWNTQLRIFSEKSNNTFIFRNPINISNVPIQTIEPLYNLSPGAPIKLDTFLIHDSSVSFSFSLAGQVLDSLRGITPGQSVGQRNPIDYGKEGSAPNNDVRLIGETTDALINKKINSGSVFVNDQNDGFNEFIYPVDENTKIEEISEAFNMPLINIDYVEIIGNPTNISATY